MILLRRLYRFIILLIHVLVGIAITAILAGLLRRSSDDPNYQRLKRWWLGRVVRIIGGEVTIHGHPADSACLLTANHVSWLDIPLLGGLADITFLSKSEVKQWPVLGWLAIKAGTLFIERGKSGGAKGATEQIARCLQQTKRVLIFPEGTTTNNQQILPFHARLFAAAVDAKADIQPVAIHYQTMEGVTHPAVPYINEQSLLTNLWAVLAEPKILIDVYFLATTDTQQLARKDLAAYSERQVREALNLF